MIRRLLYHFFWNFYDYLGTYLAAGALVTGVLLGTFAGLGSLSAMIPAVAVQVALLVVVAFVLFFAKMLGLAGIFALADRAARDQVARWKHFRAGLGRLFVPYVKLGLLVLLAFVVIAANVAFYFHLSGSTEGVVARLGLFAAGMLFVWVGLGLMVYVMVAMAVVARYNQPAAADDENTEESEEGGGEEAEGQPPAPESMGLKAVLKRAFMLFALAPMLWVFVFVFFALLMSVCIISVLGFVFVMPIYAVLSCTALDIVIRHANYLAEARTELGDGKPLGVYNRRALQLAWDWELREPRRTLRELIRPWDMRN